MRTLILSLVCVTFLAGCDTLAKFKSLSCEQNVAVVSESLATTSEAVAKASEEDLIPADKRVIVIESIESAGVILREAGSQCALDESAALKIISGVEVTIKEVKELINGYE